MLRLLLLLLLSGASLLRAAAQDQPYRPYYSKDTARVYQLALSHRNAVKAHFGTPKTGNVEFRDHYRKVVEQASSEVYNSIRYSALLDPVVEPYVQQVFARLLKANPQLPAGTRLVLTRNPEPNAHAVGNGTVMLNVGLLPRLENESQLAFILCHELAHVACRHMETGLRERLTALHSKEMKREFRRIINSEYNISSQVKALALGFSLNNNYHSRKYEKQADSLGYVLLARSSYEAPQAYRALQLLDQIDEPEQATAVPLPAYFSCVDFPKTFETGTTKPRSIFTVKDTATVLQTTDTLKTHPDCAKRMRFLHTLAQGRVAEGTQTSPPEFARLRAICRREVVQSWFDYDCYDHALFEALQLLAAEPQDAYLRAVVQLSLYELREHLREHTYTEVVSTISRNQAASFKELLYVLHALHYEDFKGLSTCFEKAATLAAVADEYALAARYAAATLAADAPATALQAQYQQQYAGGKFDKLLFPPAKAKSRR